MTVTALIQQRRWRYLREGSAWPAAQIFACTATALAAAATGGADPGPTADVELARVLRAMAMIKATILAPLLAVVCRRLNRPIRARHAGPYVMGTAMMTGACVLIGQLTAIGAASLLYYAGLLVLISTAVHDHDVFHWGLDNRRSG